MCLDEDKNILSTNYFLEKKIVNMEQKSAEIQEKHEEKHEKLEKQETFKMEKFDRIKIKSGKGK